jgi:hypothetical protein
MSINEDYSHSNQDNRSDIYSLFDDYLNEQDEKENKGVKKPKWTRIMSENGLFQNSIASFPLE